MPLPLPSFLPSCISLLKGEGSTGVLVSDGGGEGLDVLGTRMASYLDYIDIWVALCSRDAVKVRGRGDWGTGRREWSSSVTV